MHEVDLGRKGRELHYKAKQEEVPLIKCVRVGKEFLQQEHRVFWLLDKYDLEFHREIEGTAFESNDAGATYASIVA